ncbi:MAG TPA: hypothetical protein VGG19_18970 [Tepidisphaeraceae bacterium]
MKHKTLFRNLCKLLGLYFVIVGGTAVVNAVTGIFVYFYESFFQNNSVFLRSILMVIGPALQLAAGLFLLFRSEVIANWAIPGNRPYCPECGYDLTGSVSGVCPECGVHPLTGKPQ